MNAFGDMNKNKDDVDGGENGQESLEEGGGTVTSRAG